jgi:putative ABC transport system substrate-binding protein
MTAKGAAAHSKSESGLHMSSERNQPAINIDRRRLITALGGAAVAWPLPARAQQRTSQAAMPLAGYVSILPSATANHPIAAFRAGLKVMGYTEGKNVAVEFRFADGDYGRLPALIADLVGRQAAVIATNGGTPAAQALTAATKTIPIVFTTGGDPVRLGLVASLNRPGGNATGVSIMTTALEAKHLELLREIVPRAKLVAYLVNPTNADAAAQLQDIQAAARSAGQQVAIVEASTSAEFEPALAKAAEENAGALLVADDPFFMSQREQLVKIVARHALPAVYAYPEYVAAGGLMSYAASLTDTARQVGVYTGRILKGERPSDLPVVQPSKFELVINLKTAKTLGGLTMPPTLLATADQLIE